MLPIVVRDTAPAGYDDLSLKLMEGTADRFRRAASAVTFDDAVTVEVSNPHVSWNRALGMDMSIRGGVLDGVQGALEISPVGADVIDVVFVGAMPDDSDATTTKATLQELFRALARD